MPGYPPENHSWGIGTYAENCVVALKREKHECTIVSRSLGHVLNEYIGKYGELIIRIPTNNDIYSDYSSPIDLTDFAIRIVPLINGIYKEKKFDILIVADWGGEACFIIDSKREYPVIVTLLTPSFISEKWNPEASPYLSEKTKQLEKQLLQKSNYILASSKEILSACESYINPKAKIKICFLPTGLEEVINNKTTVIVNKVNKNKVISCAGRIENRKGQHILLKALEIVYKSGVDHWHLYLIGPDT